METVVAKVGLVVTRLYISENSDEYVFIRKIFFFGYKTTGLPLIEIRAALRPEFIYRMEYCGFPEIKITYYRVFAALTAVFFEEIVDLERSCAL
jgi:hypothetical protein